MADQANFANIHQGLIDLCKQHDTGSQMKLYKIYYKSMYNTAVRIMRHTGDAEDCMQEAFIKAFSKIETYKNEVAFGSWLKRIVVNTCLDELRKRKMQLVADDEILDIPADDDYCEPELLTVERIKDCISKLPDNYRIVANLFLLEGYDHEEIADILNISCSTSRIQMFRAKQKILQLLNEKQKIVL